MQRSKGVAEHLANGDADVVVPSAALFGGMGRQASGDFYLAAPCRTAGSVAGRPTLSRRTIHRYQGLEADAVVPLYVRLHRRVKATAKLENIVGGHHALISPVPNQPLLRTRVIADDTGEIPDGAETDAGLPMTRTKVLHGRGKDRSFAAMARSGIRPTPPVRVDEDMPSWPST